MELPNPVEVRKDFSKVIENLDFFIELISTKEVVSFFEFSAQLHTIDRELIEIQHKIRLLTIKGGKYSKIFEKFKKVLIKMLIEARDIERKYERKSLNTHFENIFQHGGKLRKELVNHFKNVSKELKKLQKQI